MSKKPSKAELENNPEWQYYQAKPNEGKAIFCKKGGSPKSLKMQVIYDRTIELYMILGLKRIEATQVVKETIRQEKEEVF